MTLPIVFMYSGQGSQYYQMGISLYEHNGHFKSCMNQVDKLCSEIMGVSILKQLYETTNRPSQPFIKTTLTYPAIFMIEYALTQLLLEKNIFPNMILASSMGGFAAAVAANIFSLETALQAAIRQAQLLDEHCPEGGMLAILHDTQLYAREAYIHNFSELAAINLDSHFVISGTTENLSLITDKLQQNTITYQSLPVSHPFHSSYMDGAQASILGGMQDLILERPKLPFISCTHADFLSSLSPLHFWEMIRDPIQFQATIQLLESQQPAIYLDLGPSGTLATFVKYNLSSSSQSQQYSIVTPYGQDIKNLENVLSSLFY